MSMRKALLNIGIKSLVKKTNKGEFIFDNTVQRKLCWDINKKSLLIHSILTGYPIPPLYSRKGVDENGKFYYDMLDGKQRTNAIVSFCNGEYALGDIPEVFFENEEGDMEEIDISGLTFNELPSDLKDEIEGTTLTVYYYEDITDEEVAEMFYRLNNGKPLSAIELTRAKAKSREKIIELGKLPIFERALTTKQIGSYANEDVIIKSLILLYEDKKSLDSKDVRPVTEVMEVTEDMENTLKAIYDRIMSVHNIICPKDEDGNILSTVDKTDKQIGKRIFTRTHLVSIVPIVKRSIDENKSIDEFADWLKSFYNGGQKTSISDKYNSVIRQGANKESSVKLRLEELNKYYEQSFNTEKEELIDTVQEN